MKKFPTIGEYNQAIQKNGNLIFSTLSAVELIPSRTLPIKVYLFGSGAYAAVFKGKMYGNLFALRVFLEAGSENVIRYEKICSYLETIDSTWKVDCEFLSDEISVNGEKYPILKMNWVQGKLINDFVTENLHSKKVLDDLQKEIVSAAKDLNVNDIGHGDIQSGNMMIVGSSANFQLKLIDYDGMYTPNQNTAKSIENGRSEFNHPDRSKMHFGPYVDRFPFWVMLCALEALKFDPSLWKEVMQGGFNTLDNFLFLRSDFVNPNTSKLIDRLKNLRKDSVDFYLGKLIRFSKSPIYDTELPEIYYDTVDNFSKSNYTNNEPKSHNQPNGESERKKKFIIKCNKPGIKILSSNLEKIGSVPLELDKNQYSNKTVIATDGNQLKRIQLSPHKSTIYIEWVEPHKEEKSFNKKSHSHTKPKSEAESEHYSSTSTPNKNTSNHTKTNNIQSQSKNKKQANSKHPNQPQKKRFKYQFLIWFLIITVPLAVFPIINSHFEILDFNFLEQTSSVAEVDDTPIQEKLIQDFLKAEEQRDWYKIKSFFSPSMRRYWDLYDPNLNEVRKRYEQAWGFTSEGKNYINRITKVRDDQFDLHANYKFYNKNKGAYFQSNSVVRFEFDENNKIKATYAASIRKATKITPKENEDTSLQKESEKLSESELDRQLTKKIIEFFEAEGNKDLSKLKPLISQNPVYFLTEYYPVFSDIKSIYYNEWKDWSTRSTKILKIGRNEDRSYDVEMEVTQFNEVKKQWEKYNFLKHLEFNTSQEIKVYEEINSTRIVANNGQRTVDNSRISKPPSQYLYLTELKYSHGPPIRTSPSLNAEKIMDCPTDISIYVIERTDDIFYKVSVGGVVGYMSKGYLKRN